MQQNDEYVFPVYYSSPDIKIGDRVIMYDKVNQWFSIESVIKIDLDTIDVGSSQEVTPLRFWRKSGFLREKGQLRDDSFLPTDLYLCQPTNEVIEEIQKQNMKITKNKETKTVAEEPQHITDGIGFLVWCHEMTSLSKEDIFRCFSDKAITEAIDNNLLLKRLYINYQKNQQTPK